MGKLNVWPLTSRYWVAVLHLNELLAWSWALQSYNISRSGCWILSHCFWGHDLMWFYIVSVGSSWFISFGIFLMCLLILWIFWSYLLLRFCLTTIVLWKYWSYFCFVYLSRRLRMLYTLGTIFQLYCSPWAVWLNILLHHLKSELKRSVNI